MKKTYDCGIDLGTTNSCIAKAELDNSCQVIDNMEGSRTTPSVVYIKRDGGELVGSRALKRTDVENIRREFKRDMGTNTVYNFPASGKKKTPIELSTLILQHLHQDIERRYNPKKFTDVIITVPAAFSMVQCDATKKAANNAGFNNVILLQEPIAASIAYGVKPNASEKNFLVFDFGGGTLDVSIITTKDGYLDNLNNRGDNHLGGKDIDRALYEYIILPLLQREFVLPDGLNPVEKSKLFLSIEQAKIDLSNNEEITFSTDDLTDVVDKNGTEVYLNCVIKRMEFNNAIKSIVKKAVSIARNALTESGLTDSDISKILLVGGTTFIPLVREELRKEFDIELDCSLNPMTVVAEGAAIFANTQFIESNQDEVNTKCSYILDYDYELNTSRDTENVCGTIIGNNGKIQKVKIDCINDENSKSSIWSSGWNDVINKDNGAFDIDVKICSFNSANIYKISAMDILGNEVSLNGYIFSITHSTSSIRVLNPPLTASIGVLVTDGETNKITWLCKKGTKIPCTVKSTSFSDVIVLNKNLNPDVDDSCVFYFYEGEEENGISPKTNHVIGEVKIDSSDIDRKIPIGTEVEITIDIDISKVAKVSAYIPDYDITLFEDETLDNLGGEINILEKMTELEEDLKIAKFTLTKLKPIDKSRLMPQLQEFINNYNHYLDLIGVDNDLVMVFIKNFYELQTEIITLEREARNLSNKKSSEDNVTRADSNISSYGSDEEKRRLSSYKDKLKSLDNPSERKYVEEKIDNLEREVVSNSYEWHEWLYLSYYKYSNGYVDSQKANYWKEKANDAILKKDLNGLRTAIIRLYSLFPKSSDETENNPLADLKIE